jgi:hypothetical protein
LSLLEILSDALGYEMAVKVTQCMSQKLWKSFFCYGESMG